MRKLLLLTLVLFATVASGDLARVKILLSARTLMVGNSIRVTCRVPRDRMNRQISGMVDFVSYSSKPLEGSDQDKVTWEFWFHKIPCEATTGACELVTNDEKVHRVQEFFVVAGCETGDPQ